MVAVFIKHLHVLHLQYILPEYAGGDNRNFFYGFSALVVNENLLLSTDIILQKLGLMTEKGLTKAAILLFGKDPRKFFTDHFEIKCGKFASDAGYDEIANEKEFGQNLIQNFNAALNFMLESISKSGVGFNFGHKSFIGQRWAQPTLQKIHISTMLFLVLL